MVTHDHDEAFTVADRMAVMLDGEVVQEGTTSEVWRSPASREVAEFIGYETFVEGAAVATLLNRTRGVAAFDPHRTRGVVAMRPSALRVSGEGPVSGTVTRAVVVSDAVHLDVAVDGVGECAALADDPSVGVGQRVRLLPDARGMAVLPEVGSRA
jgi:thiamine transport system ATP-binding protein